MHPLPRDAFAPADFRECEAALAGFNNALVAGTHRGAHLVFQGCRVHAAECERGREPCQAG